MTILGIVFLSILIMFPPIFFLISEYLFLKNEQEKHESKMTNYEKLKNSDFEDFLKILRKVTVFRCEYCEARHSDCEDCDTRCEEKFAEWLESGVEE